MKKCEIHHNKIRGNTLNDKTNRTEIVYTLKSKINEKYFGAALLTKGSTSWAPASEITIGFPHLSSGQIILYFHDFHYIAYCCHSHLFSIGKC